MKIHKIVSFHGNEYIAEFEADSEEEVNRELPKDSNVLKATEELYDLMTETNNPTWRYFPRNYDILTLALFLAANGVVVANPSSRETGD